MRRSTRTLMAAVLLAVLVAPLGGFVGAGLWTGAAVEMCACGMPGGECCCELIARTFKEGDACGVSGRQGAFCGIQRNRPAPLPERNLANLDLRLVPVEGPERWLEAPPGASGLVPDPVIAVSNPLLDPPDPPPPRPSRKHA